MIAPQRSEAAGSGPSPRLGQATERTERLAHQLGRALGTAALVCLTLAAGLVVAFYPVGSRAGEGTAVVTIEPGATAAEIADTLVAARVIRHRAAFILASRLFGLDRSLRPGDYRFSRGMDVLSVMRRIQRGDVITVRVTIPEGYTLEQISALLAEKGLVDREKFIKAARDDRYAFGKGFPIDKPSRSLEGYLFPDTYRIVPGRSEEEIIRQMVARFMEVAYPVLAAGRERTGRSIHDLLTMASIIEKEAVIDEERPLIASVFYNRLARGMPLQSDPTVQYALHGDPAPLSYADLLIDSPYNTYRYPGLPPQPISNPGLASIRAAVDPADSPYLYFVARGDGSHIFSRTYRDHLAAIARLGR
ncbi:MAG TPA: endolytic transglycosylase MltG [Limnochordia bacterium]